MSGAEQRALCMSPLISYNKCQQRFILSFSFPRGTVDSAKRLEQTERVQAAHWKGKKQENGQMERWTDRQSRGMVDSSFLSCLEWSKSSLEFGNIHGRVVSMSPRLTFLMQDWGIQRSAPLKFLVGVRREAARLLKTVCNIDIKTQHIEWCQLKFHSVPFGKLGSWACQCEMNNETSLALLIFYLMWNSPLLLPEAPQEPMCT